MRRRRWSLLAAVAAAVLSSIAGIAQAAVVVHAWLPGPVALVGDTILFQQGTSEVDAAVTGGGARRIVRGPGQSVGEFFTTLEFHASPALLAFAASSDPSYHGFACLYVCTSDLSAGPVEGPYRELWRGCGINPGVAAFAVDGSVLAYSLPSCTDTSGETYPYQQIVVQDTAAGAGADVTIPVASTYSLDLALSGRALAAVSADGKLQVWDGSTGEPRYSIPLPVSRPDFNRGLQVRDDWVAVFLVSRTSGCDRVAWASPAAPTVHPLPGCVEPVGPRIVGERVAYVTNGALVASALDGSSKRTLLMIGKVPVNAFDFDGSRLLVSLPACDGGATIQIANTTTTTPARVDPRCRGEIPVQRARPRQHRLSIRVSCSSGCVARLEVTSPTGAQLGRSAFVIRYPGHTKTVRVRLGSKAPANALHTVRATLIVRGLDGREAAMPTRSLAVSNR